MSQVKCRVQRYDFFVILYTEVFGAQLNSISRMVGVHVHPQAFGAKSSCVRHIDLKSIYIAVAVLNVLPNAMMSDIVPYGTVATGVNQEGIPRRSKGYNSK